MGEQQRPAFRFRLPWMLPSAPAPPRPAVVTPSPPVTQTPASKPETQTTNKPTDNPETPLPQRQPFSPRGIVTRQPPPPPPPPQAPISPEADSQVVNNQTSAPSTKTTPETPGTGQLTDPDSTPSIQQKQSPSDTTPTTTTPSQIPPLRSPRLSAAAPPLPQAEATPESESKPSPPPSYTGFPPQISQEQASPPTTKSPATPQLPLPSTTASQPTPPPSVASPPSTKSPATSLLSSPSPTASQPTPPPSEASPESQASSRPPEPSHTSPQLPAASQFSSPARTQPEKPSDTISQPQYPPFSDLQPSGQTSLIPSSPSLTTTNVQPTVGDSTGAPSPSKTLNPIESFQSPTYSKPLSPISEEKTNIAESQRQSLEDHSEKDITDREFSNSMHAATTQLTETATEPAEEAKEIPSQMRSDDAMVGGYPMPPTNSDAKPMETKNEMDIVENTTSVTNDKPKQKTVAEHLVEALSPTALTEEQPKVAFQAEERQQEKQEILRKKQTKTMTLKQKDTITASESSNKTMESNEERASFQKDIRNDISNRAHKMAIARLDNPMEGKPGSVINMLGVNTGAYMKLGSESAKREAKLQIHKGHKTNFDESAEATTDGDKSSKHGMSNDTNTEEDQLTEVYINSNIQNINNSIVLNSSITERNPGVHVALPHYPMEHIKSNEITESLETHKAEVNITPSEKHSYDEPTTGRRSGRVLFEETSDSGPDGAREESTDYDIDVV